MLPICRLLTNLIQWQAENSGVVVVQAFERKKQYPTKNSWTTWQDISKV